MIASKAVCIALVVLFLVNSVFARTYTNPVSASNKCRPYGTDTDSSKGDEWYTYKQSGPCEDCCKRCYIAHFDTVVQTSDCTYPGFCSEEGEKCEVYMFVKTRPCNRCCEGGSHAYSLSEECNEGALERIHSTISTCEIQRFDVCLGPNHVYMHDMFDEDCTHDASFEMQAYEKECEQIELKDCTETNTGSLARWIFDDSANYNGWPNECFWDHHFKATHESLCTNINSSFRGWCPPNGPSFLWLQNNFDKSHLIPIDCDNIDEKRQELCIPFSPPAK